MLRLSINPVMETAIDYRYVVEHYCNTDEEILI
jgi:hypothetical protein